MDWLGSTLRIFFKRSFVSGRDTSGERGPPPSPCFGPHGTGSTGFWMRSGMKKTLRGNIGKASCALLLPVPDACQTNLLMAKFGLDEACCDSLCDFFFLRLLVVLDSFRPDTYAGAAQIA